MITKKQSSPEYGLQVMAADVLASYGLPAISRYELAVRLFKRLQTASPAWVLNKRTFEQLCASLVELRLLEPIEPVSKSRGYVLFGNQKASAGELLCAIDPFAHVSHLGALEFHGLTDRFAKVLYITRPSLPNWRSMARDKMAHDLGGLHDAYLRARLPLLRVPEVERVGGSALHISHQSHLGAFRIVAGSSLRVSTIGRAFLEMVRDPNLCGGIQHVIDIYRAQASRYLELIVQDIDRHGQPIDKVRAGFLLAQVCGLEHPSFSVWQGLASRGGSRKLDPDAEYAPVFSQRWMLSINVPSLSEVVEVAAVDTNSKSSGLG